MVIERDDIVNLIADHPWLLDDRLLISSIPGRDGSGRTVEVGHEGYAQQVDLLFKDSRDGRPVIVQVKAGGLKAADVAVMMGFKALLTSLEDAERQVWQNDFGINYYIPKMIVVCWEASEKARISAALAGINICQIAGVEAAELNFDSIAQIESRLQSWEYFTGSGKRTVLEREKWVEQVFNQVRDFIEGYGDSRLETCTSLSATALKNSYVRGRVFPFINLPIKYLGRELVGLYEYFDETLDLSDSWLYCDIVVQVIYYSGEPENRSQDIIEQIARELLKKMGYDIIRFSGGLATFKVKRELLESPAEFSMFLKRLVDDARTLQKEISD